MITFLLTIFINPLAYVSIPGLEMDSKTEFHAIILFLESCNW